MTTQPTTENFVRLIASSQSWIEGEAIRQLLAVSKLDGMRLAVGFPDLHPGKGCPVGAAFVTEGVIYPHFIGGDIGCGMTLWKTDLLRRKARLDRWKELPFDLEHPWEGDGAARLAAENLDSTPIDQSFGTLGGGNHFAELQAVERVFDRDAFAELTLDREEMLLLVHSGSRAFGEAVFRAHAADHGAAGVATASEEATRYLLGHDHAVRWARASRAVLAERFLGVLGAAGETVHDSCHNSIASRAVDGEPRWIHRKGAVPADASPLVIPGTRGSFTYLVQPCGDGASHAWSLAHGAGRKYCRSDSRARMRERFRPEQLVQTGLGGRVLCGDRDLLYEEAPPAYKDIEQVIADLVDAGLARVIATLRPLLTYKTRSGR